eukprot:scaffold1220_cov259-Pinguiococcus_pyrenoidosus.AAC.149
MQAGLAGPAVGADGAAASIIVRVRLHDEVVEDVLRPAVAGAVIPPVVWTGPLAVREPGLPAHEAEVRATGRAARAGSNVVAGMAVEVTGRRAATRTGFRRGGDEGFRLPVVPPGVAGGAEGRAAVCVGADHVARVGGVLHEADARADDAIHAILQRNGLLHNEALQRAQVVVRKASLLAQHASRHRRQSSQLAGGQVLRAVRMNAAEALGMHPLRAVDQGLLDVAHCALHAEAMVTDPHGPHLIRRLQLSAHAALHFAAQLKDGGRRAAVGAQLSVAPAPRLRALHAVEHAATRDVGGVAFFPSTLNAAVGQVDRRSLRCGAHGRNSFSLLSWPPRYVLPPSTYAREGSSKHRSRCASLGATIEPEAPAHSFCSFAPSTLLRL